ncbi:rod shape-determining protein RodA [Candidatus Nardonella dryophthoridicola]|uniref:rod shape-determining protein RodA n=1 Tax=Candidatus Nardonella dryophthoridicola TaxID=1971485 RepID=UPI001AD85743|nr:rod shape-determining protein RodA [Candidatus Nardonella dryophthoridicola]QTJ62797.1 rod shape-determining protein RodA [Candidatus Nardonella dryophthoridicola]
MNFYKIKNNIYLNYNIFLYIIILLLINLILVYSASNRSKIILFKNIFNIIFSFIILIFFININSDFFYKNSFLIYIINNILLILVLFSGLKIKGVKRWINIRIFNFQPSEVSKFTTSILITKLLYNNYKISNFFLYFLIIFLVLIPSILTLIQPDLGTSITIILSSIITMYLSGLNINFIINIILFFFICFIIGWFTLFKEYQKNRIMSLLGLIKDPLGINYNLIQSKIAIGSGGIFGKGLFNGTQSKLNFIPEGYTDFIFSVFSEELGFIGILTLIFIYFMLIKELLDISKKTKNIFNKILSSSITLNIFMSIFINISMVIGIIPIVGTTLPLLSYGGSSIISNLLGIGIIMCININNNKNIFKY